MGHENASDARVVVIDESDSVDGLRLDDSAVEDGANVVILTAIAGFFEVVCGSRGQLKSCRTDSTQYSQ
jgi:hypothetical protein